MFGNVLGCPRMVWETPKSFMGGWVVGGWYVAITVSTQVQTS